MNNETGQKELEEIVRLEFNNNAMVILAEQCLAEKQRREAEILKNFIMMNEIRIAHIKSLNASINTNFKRNIPTPEGQRRMQLWGQRWGLIDRVEHLWAKTLTMKTLDGRPSPDPLPRGGQVR